MEIRMNVDEEFMERLQAALKEQKATEITREALTLLSWAAEEAKQGRVILSSKPDGTDVHRLAMPGLERAARLAKAR